MTTVGAVAATIAFIVAGLPAETPIYVKLCLGAVNAGLSFYAGLTHAGTK